MKITYQIEPEDFIAFNLSYMRNTPEMRKKINRMRLVCAGIILIGGIAMMVASNTFDLVSLIIYIILAALVYRFLPRVMDRRVRRSIMKLLDRPEHAGVCSEKVLNLKNNEIYFAGGENNDHYPYGEVKRITEDAEHYFIHAGKSGAIIVPFRAFSSGEEKAAFYNLLCEHVQQKGGKITA